MNQRTPTFENLLSIYERVKASIADRTIQPPFPVGVGGIDDITRGYPKGKVTVIASRTSEGKTSFSLQTAVHLANIGKAVAFISLEDDKEGLVERIICNLFRIDNYELSKGKIEQIMKHDKTIKRIFENMTLLVLDGYGFNFKEFSSIVLDMRPKPDLVFFDYIQLIEYPPGKKYDTISKFFRDAHQLAIQEKIGIVINSQINRAAVEAKRPHLHNLEGAGVIEQVGWVVIIIHTPSCHGDRSYDYSSRTETGMKDCPGDYVEFQIEKNKNGKKGIVRMRFTGQHYLFQSWDDNG